MEEKVLLLKRFSKSEHKYWLVIRLKAIKYKKTFSTIYLLTSTASLAFSLSYLYSLKTSSFLNTYKPFIFFFITSLVLWLLRNIYD